MRLTTSFCAVCVAAIVGLAPVSAQSQAAGGTTAGNRLTGKKLYESVRLLRVSRLHR